jgi:hypothetical protein
MSALLEQSSRSWLTDELVDLQTDLVEKSRGLLVIVQVGRSLSLLLNGLLNVVRLGSKLLGLGGIVSNKDVVD